MVMQYWVMPRKSGKTRLAVEREREMYVIVVTVYTKAFKIEEQRVWQGRIFPSADMANEVRDSIKHPGDITLVVKALR